jgi:hypothetical protein
MDFLRDRRVDEWEEESGLDDPKSPRRESGYSPTLLGYSLAGCFPAEPASASPNENQYTTSPKERKEETEEACVPACPVASALPRGRGPRLPIQSEVAPRLGEIPSVNLIETVWQREKVAAEYSVSCLKRQA